MTRFADVFCGCNRWSVAPFPAQKSGLDGSPRRLRRMLSRGTLIIAFLSATLAPIRAAAEAWVPITPPPIEARAGTATALADGRILLAGGVSGPKAYLYDPITNRWTAAGQMLLPRQHHAAVLLPSGKILVSGGYYGNGNFTAQSELFDPATLSWTATAPMTDARYFHTLTALRDGRVLATGGNAVTIPSPRRAEVFDEKAMRWMPAGVTDATGRSVATLLANGEVLVVGGEGSSALSVSQIFNPTTLLWRTTAPLRDPRWSHAAAVMADGSVLVSGGYSGQFGVATAERFDTITEQWSAAPIPLVTRADHRLVTLDDGRTLSVAGVASRTSFADPTDSTMSVSDVELLRPTMTSWVAQAPLNSVAGPAQLVKIQSGRIYVIGAYAAETLDPAARPLAGHVDPIWGAAGRSTVVTPVPPSGRPGVLASAFDIRTGNTVLVTSCQNGHCLTRFDRRGIVDIAFGTKGIATVANAGVADLKILPDGKIIITGFCNALCLYRLNRDGSADTTFGVNGRVLADAGSNWSGARIKVAPGGEIYVAGSCGATGARALCAMKFNAQGVPDSRFVAARAAWGAATSADVSSLRVAATGELTVVAYCSFSIPCAVQFSATGTVLTTTGSNSALTYVPFAAGHAKAPGNFGMESVALADGSSLVAYICGEVATQTTKTCVVKLDAKGKLNTTYGQAGYAIISPPSDCLGTELRFAHTSASADGKAVVTHTCYPPSGVYAPLFARAMRLDTNGQLDRTFEGSVGSALSVETVLAGESGSTLLLGRNNDASGYGGEPQLIVGYRLVGAPTDTIKPMIEYRYAPLDYYFLTGRESEQTLLDSVAGWQRTGESIPVFHTDAIGRSPLYRFYFDKVARNATRGSHFYTLIDSERAALDALNPTNTTLPAKPVNEYVDGFASTADADGNCTTPLQPVYRLFRGNARFPDDPNHRFTTKRAIYDQFVDAGWTGEGVRYCAPPSTP